MPARTSGLERDLNLIRRRAWLFIPFAVAGILAALFIGDFSGESNAVASLTLDTTVHDLVLGGDRGLRIFEAQEMTNDPRFKEKVVAATGEPEFDYSRFSVSLSPISVADGISRGILTISITDPEKATAERYRAAFVDVFAKEYTQPDGLWRTRFVDRRRTVAETADASFNALYEELKARLAGQPVDLDTLLDTRSQSGSVPIYEELTAMRGKLAEVEGAIEGVEGTTATAAAAVASSVLGQPVAAGDAVPALTARKASLEAAIERFRAATPALAESQLDSEALALLNEARGQRQVRDESYVRLANAEVAVGSAESYIESSYSISGGVTGPGLGRIAIALAITVVFGLIAIYAVEWLRPSTPAE